VGECVLYCVHAVFEELGALDDLAEDVAESRGGE
jgi:hypothetical protein